MILNPFIRLQRLELEQLSHSVPLSATERQSARLPGRASYSADDGQKMLLGNNLSEDGPSHVVSLVVSSSEQHEIGIRAARLIRQLCAALAR